MNLITLVVFLFSSQFQNQEREQLQRPVKISIHEVNIDVDAETAEKIFRGEAPAVKGHKAYRYREDDRLEYVLLAVRPIVTERDFDTAWVDPGKLTQVTIILTDRGGEKIEAATRPMIKGKSQLATVIDGKVFQVATFQADALGKHFTISGMEPKDAKLLSRRVNQGL